MKMISTALLSAIFALLLSFSSSEARGSCSGFSLKSSAASFPAIFVFGDSTSDPGNNNYIATAFKSNFAPYGRDFINKEATGRFSDGRLTSDFIAEYVGIKEFIPPYLDRNLTMKDLLTGVSFASAGSGFDPMTPLISGVISMSKQLEYLSEYRKRIEDAVGKKKADELMNKALFIVGAGTNDFVVNYYTFPIRRRQYNVTDYQLFVMDHMEQFVKGLRDQGARKIAVAGLAPMGCLPLVITAKSGISPTRPRNCIDTLCSVSRDYNHLLQTRLNSIQLSVPGHDHATKIAYVDIYSPMLEIIQHPAKFGFEEVSSGCCGTGYLEASFLCNPRSYVCANASKYVFWDAIHPTQATYYLVFKTVRPIVDFLASH